jgi:hypothetical protein
MRAVADVVVANNGSAVGRPPQLRIDDGKLYVYTGPEISPEAAHRDGIPAPSDNMPSSIQSVEVTGEQSVFLRATRNPDFAAMPPSVDPGEEDRVHRHELDVRGGIDVTATLGHGAVPGQNSVLLYKGVKNAHIVSTDTFNGVGEYLGTQPNVNYRPTASQNPATMPPAGLLPRMRSTSPPGLTEASTVASSPPSTPRQSRARR